MVMEKPSPLLVGREFVRQYYTLLNQAPDMLHRVSPCCPDWSAVVRSGLTATSTSPV
uniref:G3BP stress granule assembly factor 1 n=1 Tax=Homo sapiens TaxID=9606 RepID=A0A7I2V4Y8_HUMAN